MHEFMENDASNMSYVELISWVEKEAGNLKSPDKHVVDKCKSPVNNTMDKGKNPVRKIVDKGESLLKKTMNKGKSKVLVYDIPVKKHVCRNNGIVIEENVNPVAMDTDSDSESEDVDEFNYTLYTGSEIIANKGYGVGDSETIMEHEEFMDDLIRKLRDGDGITDPFKIVESKVEKYPIQDVETHWKMRKPKLSGLPCAHVIAVIFKLNRRVEDYVPGCFRKQSFYSAYHQYLTPVGGMDFWPESNEMSKVLPPKPKKPGRPRKKRMKAAHENKNTNKVSRSGITMTCLNCFQKGHNKNGCKNPTIALPPKLPTKKGSLRKAQVSDSSLLDEDLVDAPLDSAPVDVIAQNIQNAPNAETIATQSIQAQGITPHVVVPDISPRPKSERILNRKLAKNPSRISSSNSNSLDLE
nr:pentatricopeptide repeat-containing protein [Tanacetum cinerariifolium]